AAGIALTAACGGGDPIRIGLAGPFEEPRAQSMRLAAELAVRQINDSGGVRGRPLELVVEDDQGSNERAVEVARRFHDDPSVVAVIGHLASGTSLAAAPVYNDSRNPLAAVSPSATSPALSAAGPYTFRVCPTDLVHGARLAAWVVEQLGATRASVMYLNDDYGRGVRRVFDQEFVRRKGELVADDPYLDDLPSFVPYLERIRRRGGTEALMIAGTRAGAERILAGLDSVGLRPTVLGGDGIAGMEQGGAAVEGVLVSTSYLPDRPGARNAAFVRAYRAAYGDREPDHRGASAYDAVYLLARALREAGVDRERVRDYLAGVGTESPAFEGVTGSIAFDENGDVPNKDVIVGVMRGGRIVTAPERRQ
ncbi:MAG TPA: ABC transporter substrate-binding protein, partial [Gemmatimonadales bacterium]|nr:ABC transporter substrate-binding protein [Gemmatimonadales bacterium]